VQVKAKVVFQWFRESEFFNRSLQEFFLTRKAPKICGETTVCEEAARWRLESRAYWFGKKQLTEPVEEIRPKLGIQTLVHNSRFLMVRTRMLASGMRWQVSYTLSR
jgi:hypothetical protein